MKIFLIGLGIAFLVVTLVMVVGALLPKHHVATRVATFKATPEQVFHLISGPQDWRTDLKNYQVFTENGRGMRREISKNGQTLTMEFVESQPPWLLKSRISDKNLPFGGSWTYRIEARNDGCALTITEDGEVYNPVFRFISRFVIGHTRTIDNYLSMLGNALAQNRTAQGSNSK
jgi:hypothetical protein